MVWDCVWGVRWRWSRHEKRSPVCLLVPGCLAQRKQSDFSFLNFLWTHSHELAHGFLKSVCNCQPCSHIRHKSHMYFRKVAGLFCMCFPPLLPALSYVWQDSGCARSSPLPLSSCRADSSAGPSLTQLHLSALLVTWHFLWTQLPLMALPSSSPSL